jgi:RNA polymerase sigma-70 factor, ECF subfamily
METLGEVSLDALLEVAERSWSDAMPDREALSAFLAEKTNGHGATTALHLEDLLLAYQCVRRIPRAFTLLEQLLQPLRRELTRTFTADDVEEALQRLRERLLVATADRKALIADYGGRGPLAAWLRVAAIRTASNLRREDRARVPDAKMDAEARFLQAADPELAALRTEDRAVLAMCIREAFATMSPQQRNLLRLHLVDGLGLDRLAPLLGVHRATAARQVASARAELRQLVMTRVQVNLKLDGEELRSWLRLVRSQLGISVRILLAEPPAAG